MWICVDKCVFAEIFNRYQPLDCPVFFTNLSKFYTQSCDNEVKIYCHDIPKGEARVIRCLQV